MKFDLEYFIKAEIVIHCENQTQAEHLISILESKTNVSYPRLSIEVGIKHYSEDACFLFRTLEGEINVYYNSIDGCIVKGYEVVKFKDLIFDKEVNNMKTLEQFAKDNELSGLVVKYTNGWKGLIVTLGGKNYVLRGGDKFKLVIIELGDEQKLYRPKINTGLLEDILNDNNLELVWEKQEVDWSKVPIDTKVLIKWDGHWLRRYFAGVNEEGKPLVFHNGQTSWSKEGSWCVEGIVVLLLEGNEHLLEDNK